MKKKLWLILGLLHWAVSFLTDPLVFTCESNLRYGVWKACFLAFVIGFYQTAGFLVRRIRSGDEKVKRGCRFAGIYFLLMLLLLLLTWPGIWRIDEFAILSRAKALNIYYWQGYLTSVYYILCMMMIPTPAAVILFMCLINSAAVGYLIGKLWEYTGGKKRTLLMYLPFLFLPVLDSNLYPMRMSIYAFLELLLLAKLCFWCYEKRMPGKWEGIAVLFLAGIVTCWRTESIYYLILFPVLLLVLLWRLGSRRQKIRAIVLYLVFALVLVGIQKVGEGTERGNRYELTAMIRPLTPLLVEAAVSGEEDLIQRVDRVVNCAYIFQGASEGMDGIEIFWNWVSEGLMRDNYTEEEYRDYKLAYYELILHHPMTFLRERLETYLQSTELLGNITEQEPPSPAWNQTLRYRMYALLELRSMEDYYSLRRGAALVYSSLVPSLILAAGALYFLSKRKLVYAGCALMVFVKLPLIFLTSPETLFMYYYPLYLCGWVLLFFGGILLSAKKGKAYEANYTDGII